VFRRTNTAPRFVSYDPHATTAVAVAVERPPEGEHDDHTKRVRLTVENAKSSLVDCDAKSTSCEQLWKGRQRMTMMPPPT
jgi:hypothetical protein